MMRSSNNGLETLETLENTVRGEIPVGKRFSFMKRTSSGVTSFSALTVSDIIEAPSGLEALDSGGGRAFPMALLDR